jgi:hypothetical protein
MFHITKSVSTVKRTVRSSKSKHDPLIILPFSIVIIEILFFVLMSIVGIIEHAMKKPIGLNECQTHHIQSVGYHNQYAITSKS